LSVGGIRESSAASVTAAGLACGLLVCAAVLLRGAAFAASPSGGAAPVEALSALRDGQGALFVDEAACVECHASQVRAWTGSDHDLAMQKADEGSVRGDFADAQFLRGDVTTRFFRRDDAFLVGTDGPDGKPTQFEVGYVFGVEPLQQLLLGLPGGRLQALSIAWDTRGRRWFDLYPDEHIDHRDVLHWTNRLQNWNQMCGECHATDYRKGYDASTDSYRTEAARFDVGCQACHGPASRHLERVGRDPSRAAQPSDASTDPDSSRAATREALRARSRDQVKSDFDVDLSAADSQVQIDTCARCHARRSTFGGRYRYGAPLLDSHLPALLAEGLYYADGQIDAEVYVYGSFMQSKMHAKGVRCSDCHEPHAAALRADGNALCVGCHNAGGPAAGVHVDTSSLRRANYDSAEHHHHEPGKPGSSCVDCHAPARTYMIVDPRHDHGFRVPRPDLSVRIGTPNACNGCHTDRTAVWAAEAVERWFGPERPKRGDFAVAIDAGRHAKAGAARGLLSVVSDAAEPAIVRATALDLLADYPGRPTFEALRRGLGDRDALVRHTAATCYDTLAPAQRVADLGALLDDPIRAVRMAAARALTPAAAALSEDRRASYDAARRELEAVERANADTPEALTGLGDLYAAGGDVAAARELYAKAIALDAAFVPAYVNLADLHRTQHEEAEAEAVLRAGQTVLPDDASLHGALGLVLVRTGRKDEALAELGAAARAAPENARHVYVYAVALHGAGRPQEAVALLEGFAARRADRDVLLALAAFKQEAGDATGAAAALRALAAVNPDDPALRAATNGG
jgi:predicted CXXCH cytochrome family protein